MNNEAKPEVIQVLLDGGANPNELLVHKNTLLMSMILAYQTLDYEPHLIKNYDDYTKNSTIKIIKMLIKAGAKLNAQNDKGKTALMYDVEKYTLNDTRTSDIFNILIEAGADVNIKDNQGKTVLMYVADMQYDSSGQNAVHNYIENTRSSINRELYKDDVSSASTDSLLDTQSKKIDNGYSILKRNFDSIKMLMMNKLLSTDVNIHDKDNKGETPLSLATHSHSNPSIIARLQ